MLRNKMRKQAGLTMIELMVALAIGSFLIIGAVQIYTQSRQAFVVNESIARVQETAQFAMDTIEADLRMASNWGRNSRGLAVEGRQVAPDDVERHQAQRQVDEEDPVPAEAVGEEAADERAHHGRDAEDRSEEALVAASLPRLEEVADDGEPFPVLGHNGHVAWAGRMDDPFRRYEPRRLARAG